MELQLLLLQSSLILLLQQVCNLHLLLSRLLLLRQLKLSSLPSLPSLPKLPKLAKLANLLNQQRLPSLPQVVNRLNPIYLSMLLVELSPTKN
jgi:hypothetical protein